MIGLRNCKVNALSDSSRPDVDIRNLLNPNKFIPVYLERKASDIQGLPPYSVELHLTSTCNYNCYHCSYGNRNKTAVYLREDTINVLINNLTNTQKPKGVYFSGGGEPTSLKNWDCYINKLIDKNIEVALVTNSALIKERHLPAISRLNYIAISLYSTNEETYQKITNGSNFSSSFSLPNQVKNISPNCIVGARCVINKFNYLELIDIYNKAIDSGYDYIIFIPEIDYENRGIALTYSQIEKLMELGSSAPINPQKTNLNSLVARRFNFYPTQHTDFFDKIGCQAVRLRTNAFVNYDGGIYLCQPHIENEKFCIGNLHNKEFADIWNSEKHISVINLLSKEWSNGKCRNCRSIAFNKSVFNYLNIESNRPIEIVKDAFL